MAESIKQTPENLKSVANMKPSWLVLVSIVVAFVTSTKVKIGLLLPLDKDRQSFKNLLTKSINKLDAKRLRLKHLDSNQTNLVHFEPIFADISHSDPFLTTKSVCQLVENEVVSVLGIDLKNQAAAVASILNFVGIPLLQINPWLSWNNEQTQFNTSVNFYPSKRVLSAVAIDLIQTLDWNPLTIFYQEDQDILLWSQYLSKTSSAGFLQPSFLQLPKSNSDVLKTLLNLKHSSGSSQNLILFGSDPAAAGAFVDACQTSGLLQEDSNLLIASLGLTQRVLKPYMYSGANIIYIGLANTDPNSNNFYQALVHDAVTMLSMHLHSYILEDFSTNLSCWSGSSWPAGHKLIRSMASSEAQFVGETGWIQIDKYGERSNFEIVIKKLDDEQGVPLGTWSPSNGLLLASFEGGKSRSRQSMQDLKNPLVITTVLSEPYAMHKRTSERLQGNEQYEGFIVDLAAEIAAIVGFNYTIVPANAHGSIDKNGQWNGMIRELLDERADMAMADLTINYQREMVVDFTMPFLDLGISVLYVKAQQKDVNLFAFLSPLSAYVWLLMILAGISVSITMYFIARFSPYETLELNTDEGETPFLCFHHCLWFSIASWVQQGCDFLPRAISSRTVATSWWFFTLIMISSYTANLAAFLTIERMEAPINDVGDLARQSKIKYGCLKSGSTNAFFRDATDETFQKLFRVMSKEADAVLVNSNKEGIDKVLQEQGNYAFFMESTTIEYVIERYCQLQQIGGLLDSKSYGIAVQQGSPLRSPISNAIIKLSEMGRIQALKKKWWEKERGGGTCQEEESSASGVSALNLINVGGIFLVLLIGLILGSCLALTEHCWSRWSAKRIFT